MNKVVDSAVRLITQFEGFSNEPYLCPADKWTIGYGRTGPDVTKETGKVTEDDEKEWVAKRVRSDYQWLKETALTRCTLTTNQWAALCSLVYNIGRTAFLGSSIRKVLITNARYGTPAADDNKVRPVIEATWKLWDKAGGKQLGGLVRRRRAELEHFYLPS